MNVVRRPCIFLRAVLLFEFLDKNWTCLEALGKISKTKTVVWLLKCSCLYLSRILSDCHAYFGKIRHVKCKKLSYKHKISIKAAFANFKTADLSHQGEKRPVMFYLLQHQRNSVEVNYLL